MEHHANAEHTHASLPGGWSAFRPVDAKSREIFEKATKGILGVEYEPKEVSTQIVAGTNYRFRCDAHVVGHKHDKYTALVEIYQPLHGDPTITRIIQTSGFHGHGELKPGGWTPFGPLDAKALAVFEEAMRGWVGVGYKPLEVSTQVVAGINYRYICDATVIVPDAPTHKALVEIFEPLHGKPRVVRIESI